MKRIKIKYTLLVLLAGSLLVAGCKKDFVSLNENRNFPEQVDVKFALPAAESYLAYTIANQLALVGGFWSQYWTQGPNASQYATLDQYVYYSSDADRPWAVLYAGTLKDLQFIYETAQADSTKKNYGAIARILQAYTYQVIVDNWGAAPFREALQLEDGIIAPKYDDEETIYDGLIDMVNEGQAMLDDAYAVPEEDLLYHGDLFTWYKFANTLKLRIYMRQTEVRNGVAQQGISTMIANQEPFLEIGEDGFIGYTDQQFQQSPLFTTAQALSTTSNIFASATIIQYLDNRDDPRVEDFFAPNGNGGYAGLAQGEGKLLPGNQLDASWSKPSDQIMGPTSRTFLMSAAESYFLQAEAVVRGFGGSGEQALYEAGIESSFSLWENASGADLPAYLAGDSVLYPAAGTQQEKLRAILGQKWAAMTGNQNVEAWAEWRRTGIPAFSPSLTSILGGGTFPARIIYPSDEVNSNTNFPGTKSVETRIWWDVN